ncbi:unnamed protein product [Eretmochelys imbricata]
MKTFPELSVFSYSSSSYKADLPHKFKSVETGDHLSHMMTSSTEGCTNPRDGFIVLPRRIVWFVSFFLLCLPSPGDSCTTHSCAPEDIKESFIVQAQEQRIELLEISEHLDITQEVLDDGIVPDIAE